jgi:putative lipoprotein
MRILFAVALLLCHIGAQAQDTWSGKDKQLHFGVSLALGAAARQLAPNNELAAFGAAMVPGLVKELIDKSQEGNHFSAKDLVANALGAYVGVKVGGLLIQHNRITYTKEF